MISKKAQGFARGMCILALLVALCSSFLFGCGSLASDERAANAQGELTVTDMAGRSVVVPAELNRVIGIGSSSLRILTYLQATDLVVGVEQSEKEITIARAYSYAYQEVFKELPVIGDGGSQGATPNEEAIIELAPQLIFASLDKDTADALQERTGIPVLVLTLSDLVFDQVFYDNVTLVGSIVGKRERALAIVAYMKEIEADLTARTAAIGDDERQSAYAAGINFRGGHGFTGTEAHFPPFAVVSVENSADATGLTGAFDIDLESVVSMQPDLIFIESGNLNLVREDYVSNPAYFLSLEAVQNAKVYSLIGYRFYGTNVELALANCYQVGAMAYPEQFADIDPAKMFDEITEFFLGKKMYADFEAAGYSFGTINLTAL